MVAERSVSRRSFFVKKGGGIRSENADISNDKPWHMKICGIMVAVSSRVSM